MEGKEPIPIKRIENHTLKELADHYLEWAQRQRSFESKRGFIIQLLDVFGNLPLRRISTRLIEEFQTERMKRNKPATVNRLLSTLKHMYTKSVDWEMVEEEALKRVRKVKLLPENNRRLRYLSQEECRKLVSVCPPHVKPIVITALNTGMRKEDILSLKWEENIDMHHGYILLNLTKNGERRQVPMTQEVRDALNGIVRRIKSSYIFADAKGNRYGDIKRSFNTSLIKAGIKDFRFHDLRHTFASHLVMGGIDLATLRELLGHKNLTMTLRYSHLSPNHKEKAVQILAGITSGKTNTVTLKEAQNFQ